MCRIRFGIDGIYFEELEPIQIRHNHYQPLISNLPSARDKVSANGTVVVDAGAGRKKSKKDKQGQIQVAQQQHSALPSPPSGNDANTAADSATSSSSSDGGDQNSKTKKDEHDSNIHTSPQDSQPKNTSSRSEKPKASGKDQKKGVKLVHADTGKAKLIIKPFKKVRFSDTVEVMDSPNIVSDTEDTDTDSSSSSCSSCDSYIDPSPPFSEGSDTALDPPWRRKSTARRFELINDTEERENEEDNDGRYYADSGEESGVDINAPDKGWEHVGEEIDETQDNDTNQDEEHGEDEDTEQYRPSKYIQQQASSPFTYRKTHVRSPAKHKRGQPPSSSSLSSLSSKAPILVFSTSRDSGIINIHHGDGRGGGDERSERRASLKQLRAQAQRQ